MKTLSPEIPNINRAQSYIQITVTAPGTTGLNVGDNGKIYLNQNGVTIDKNENGALYIKLKYDDVEVIFEKH